jgi:hypothetical protein
LQNNILLHQTDASIKYKASDRIMTGEPGVYTPLMIATIFWETLEEYKKRNHNDKVF